MSLPHFTFTLFCVSTKDTFFAIFDGAIETAPLPFLASISVRKKQHKLVACDAHRPKTFLLLHSN